MKGRDGNLYGTTFAGGTNDWGTVFKITTNGVFTELYSFSGGGDGGGPQAPLMECADGNFYGSTALGGTNGGGTVFRISTNGVLTTLHPFNGPVEGSEPIAGLVQGRDGNLYGSTSTFDIPNTPRFPGTVFKMTTNGALTTLHVFPAPTNGGMITIGYALLQGKDGNFYGTTEDQGSNGWGSVFRITPDGQFTTLYSFGSVLDTNGARLDGADPRCPLVQVSDGDLYGTTYKGGSFYDSGTFFRISTNGVFAKLHSFGMDLAGAAPEGSLVQAADGSFYGTTQFGQYPGAFRITTNGTLTPLYPATANGGLVQAADGSFYGTEYTGLDAGSVFRLTVTPEPPVLNITLVGTNVVLTWPALVDPRFNLQATTNLLLPVWSAVSPLPAVIDGQNTVTNPLTGQQQFFRLSR